MQTSLRGRRSCSRQPAPAARPGRLRNPAPAGSSPPRGSRAVAVPGVAGPDGGTREKPVGLVYFAAGRRDEPMRSECVLFGDLGRAEIRRRSVERALGLLLSFL